MMVSGLQLPFQSSPLDGISAKSQSMDSETIQSLSFGEILKTREKQLQQEQEVSASSLAAALATLQTLSIAMQSVPNIEISNNTAKVDAQTNAATLMHSQIKPSTSLNGFSQLAADTVGTLDQPVVTQTATGRFISTEQPASVSDRSQNIRSESPETASPQFISVETPQIDTPSLSKAETTTPPIYKDIKNQALNTVMKTTAQAEVTPAPLNRSVSEILPERFAAELEKPVLSTKIVEQQISTPGSIKIIPNSMIAVDAKNETENVAAQPKFQTSINVNSLAQSLGSRVETKDIRVQSGTNSQPVTASKFFASEAPGAEINMESGIDKSALLATIHFEVSDTTRSQSLASQGEIDQKTIPFESQQAERPISTPAPAVEFSYEAPVQDSSVQSETNQATIPFASKRDDRSVNIPAPRGQAANRLLSGQVDESINTSTTKATTADATVTQNSFRQSQITGEANPFTSQLTSEQGGNAINTTGPTVGVSNEVPVQYSSTASATDQTMTQLTSQQTGNLPNTPVPTNQTPHTPLIQNSDIQFVTDDATISINSEQAENLVNTITSQVEASNSTSVQPSVTQAGIDQRTIPFVSPQIEDSINIPVPTVQVPDITPVPYSSAQGTADQETLSFTPQPDVVSSNILMPAMERSIPDLEIPFSSLALSSKETEIGTETVTKHAATGAEVPVTSQDWSTNDSFSQHGTGTNQNIETSETESTTRSLRYEVNNSTDNNINSQEFEKTIPQVSVETKLPEEKANTTAQQPAPNSEVDDEILMQDLPEIPLSNPATVSENIIEVEQFGIDDYSTTMPVTNVALNEADNVDKPVASKKEAFLSSSRGDHRTEKFVILPVVYSETADMDLVQPTPDADQDVFAAKRETIESQTGAVAFGAGVALPVQMIEVETLPYQGLPEPLPTKDIKNSKEVADAVQHIDQQKDQSSIPAVKPSLTEDKNVDQVAVPQKTVVSSAEITEAQTTVSDAEEIATATNQPLIDVANDADQEELTLEAKLVKPRVDTTTSSTEISQTPIEYSTGAKNTLSANTSINSMEVKTETTVNVEQIAINSDRPVIDAMKAQVSLGKQPSIETKITKPQTEISAENSQSTVETRAVVKDFPTPSTENEIAEVEAQTTVYSGKKVTAPSELEPSVIQAPIEIEQAKAIFETKVVVAQEDTDLPLSETQQSTSNTVFTTEANTDSETEAVAYQAVSPQDLAQAVSVHSADDLPETQAAADQKELVFEPKVDTSAPAEISQANSADPAAQAELTDTNRDGNETKIATQPKASINSEAIASQPAQSTFDPVEQKGLERPVHVDLPVTGTPNGKVEVQDKNISSVESAEKVDDVRTNSEKESENITAQASMSSTSNFETSTSKPGALTKVEAGKQILKTKPNISKDEESLSAEKQPKLNQMPESAAASTGPIKEVTTAETNGKMPINQVNAQAAEVAQQVIHQINVKLKSGPTSMHLQLNPKELGMIDVEMVSTSQGVSVTFFAEQSNTGKLLETQLNQLRESLIDSGVQLSGLNISQHGPSEQKGGFFSQDKNFTQYPQSDITRSEPDITETSRTERIAGQSGEVDYLI